MATIVSAPRWTHGPAASVGRPAAAVVYAAASFICHQQSQRSFHRDGAQWPVCARCSGLYFGGALGALLWTAFAGLRERPSRRACAVLARAHPGAILIMLGLPTAVTVTTAWLGWWDPANLLRAALAVPLGAGVGAVIIAGLAGDLR
jgi:uncharacterized membrane protein